MALGYKFKSVNSDLDTIQRFVLQPRHLRKGIVRLRQKEEIDKQAYMHKLHSINYTYKCI